MKKLKYLSRFEAFDMGRFSETEEDKNDDEIEYVEDIEEQEEDPEEEDIEEELYDEEGNSTEREWGDEIVEQKTAVKTWENGTKVRWHYRSAIGHGSIVGVHKKGKTHSDTMYSIRQTDHHISKDGKKEPKIVYHKGSALTRV